jgi:peptide deformylase
MTVLPILRWPDPRLSTPCAPAPLTDAVRHLAADMLETMYAAPGRGLAAPQVGHLIRLFVMDVTWKEGAPSPRICLNPEILWRSDTTATGTEGCLSIPGITTDIARATDIRLRWTDLDGLTQEENLSGFAAICAQHEYDHLDGLVTFDRLPVAARGTALDAYAAAQATA